MDMTDAIKKGYRVPDVVGTAKGYEVTYPDGYKSWCPKDVADAAYFKLNKNGDGSYITTNDVIQFILSYKATTLEKKTTVLHAKTITGFELVESSACVDPKNYSQELGEKYAMEKVYNKVWDYLRFVLKWAKNGLYNE